MIQTHTRDMTFCGMAAALAVVLGMVGKVLPLQLPQGGSITLETLPIFFMAFWGGWRLGVLTGCLDGVLQLFFGAFIFHPIQVVLDYPLPFALLGLAGLFPNRMRVGIGVASALRWCSHFISGYVFFGEYAPEGTPVWMYAAFYNASFVIPEALICIFLVPVLLRRFPSYAR